MNFSAIFIRRPIGTLLLAIALFLVGAAVFPLLPVASLPQVDFPTIQVTAKLPGGDPETMATSVAQPLERQFSTIAGLAQMTSENAAGSTRITLQFELNRDIDGAALDVQTAINAAARQLPANMPNPPTFRKVNPADFSILILTIQSDVLPITEVNDYADNIFAQQLSQIEGVGLVNIWGQQKPAIRIQVDPVKLASLGLDLEAIRGDLATARETIRRAIAGDDADLPAAAGLIDATLQALCPHDPAGHFQTWTDAGEELTTCTACNVSWFTGRRYGAGME